MERKAARRAKIADLFEDFRRAIAGALGAAEATVQAAVTELAEATFEMWLREDGLDAAAENDDLRRGLGNPLLADAVGRVRADHAAAFVPWVSTEPDRLTELVARAAPGAAGEPPQQWLGEPGKVDGSGPIPELWRIGTATAQHVTEHDPFPVAVPLLDESHLQIFSTPDTRTSAEALVETLLLRVVSYFQPGMVALHIWDVGRFTGALPGLYPLTRTGQLTVHDPGRLTELLDELSDHIRRVHTRVLVDGHPSVAALAASTGTRTEPWRLAVLVGNRAELSDEDRRQLQRVARGGLACGVQLVMVDLPLTVSAPVETIELGERVSCSMTGQHATVALDPPLSREQVATACHAIADECERWRARVGSFGDLLPHRSWTARSNASLHAPVGFRDGLPVEMWLGDSAPHALIGGPSGAGKTNFLFTMIGSMAARYPPDELELYLLDFKEGVSFAQFTPGRKDPSWLPQARLVGVNVNTDREFGLALLQFLSAEMRRRAQAAKAHEVTKLEELRAADPDGRWPRIVAVIDEFQYLFAERDAVSREATTLLEDVSRRGRSQGIHLVLASQDVSGIEAFWGRPAIFEQFVLRVALPRSRRVLADFNDAALGLPRWHAVINHESGIRHGNEGARIPDATARGTIDALQTQLWQRRPSGLPPPRLFDGGRAPRVATLIAELPAERGRSVAPVAVLGQVIDVAGSPALMRLSAGPGRNLAVLGTQVGDVAAVLGAATASIAAQVEPGAARFTVAALAVEAAEPARDLADRLRSGGHPVDEIGLADVGAHLADLAAAVRDRLTGGEGSVTRGYLVLYAVDGAESVLGREGLDALRAVLHGGPETGVHVLGWWRGVSRLKSTLGLGAPVDDIGCWVAFDVQGSDLSALAPGHVVNWSARPGRGLFFDRTEHSRPQVLIVPTLDEP